MRLTIGKGGCRVEPSGADTVSLSAYGGPRKIAAGNDVKVQLDGPDVAKLLGRPRVHPEEAATDDSTTSSASESPTTTAAGAEQTTTSAGPVELTATDTA